MLLQQIYMEIVICKEEEVGLGIQVHLLGCMKPGLKYILGFNIKEGYLSINPCIPKDWKEYEIKYKYENSIYNINVQNLNSKNVGVETMIVNGQIIEDKKLKLEPKGGIYNVEIIM